MTKRTPKHLLLVFALGLSLALAFASCGKKGAEDAWLSFQLLMNHVFGEGSWSAASHGFSEGALTVSGVKLTIKNQQLATPSNSVGATIDKVTISEILPPNAMRDLLNSPDWRGASDLALAKGVTVEGFRAGEDFGDAKGLFEIKLAEAKGVLLKAASASLPAGPAGYIKSLAAESAKITGVSADVTYRADGIDGAGKVSFRGESSETKGLNFGGPPLIGDGGVLDAILSMGAAEHTVSGVSYSQSEGDSFALSFIMRESSVRGASGMAAFALGSVKGLSFSLKANDPDLKELYLSLDETTVANYDGQEIAKDTLAALRGGEMNGSGGIPAILDPAAAAAPSSMADVFTYPYSFDSINTSGLRLELPFIALSAERAEYKGPVRRHVVPSFNIKVENFAVRLSPDQAPESEREDLRRWTEALGASEFRLDADVSSAYEASSGSVKYTWRQLSVRDIADLTLSLELTGLTQGVIDGLARVPMDSPMEALMVPGASEFGLKEFTIQLNDHKLTKSMLAANAKELSVSPESLASTLSDAYDGKIDEMTPPDESPAANELLKDAIRSFLTSPQSIYFAAKPSDPVTVVSVFGAALGGGGSGTRNILNSLGLYLAVNGGAPQPLVFGQ
jgi:hypothetical protein